VLEAEDVAGIYREHARHVCTLGCDARCRSFGEVCKERGGEGGVAAKLWAGPSRGPAAAAPGGNRVYLQTGSRVAAETIYD
jgi:hypothetical protein